LIAQSARAMLADLTKYRTRIAEKKETMLPNTRWKGLSPLYQEAQVDDLHEQSIKRVFPYAR